MTKQALADAQFKLKSDAFRILFDDTAEFALQEQGIATFRGYRVLPIDGTNLALEDTYHLRAYYGVTGDENGYAAARASVMVDVLNKGVILDARLDKLSFGESKLAMRHFDRLTELNIENPLLIFDSNYASADMFERLGDTAFLFRIKRRFNAQIGSLPPGNFVKEITIKKKVFCPRVLKFKLSSGEFETFSTNLPKDEVSSDELKELYNLRWGVETPYRTLKSALQIENFSGISQLVVEQDFFATMFLKNMVAFAKLDSDTIIEENDPPTTSITRKQTKVN